MPSASASPRWNRVLRLAAMSPLVLLGAFCALLLAIRFVAFPQVESHRGEIAGWLTSRIGQPVEIDGIVTGWNGWNPELSVRGFRVRERGGAGATLLELPRVDLVIAWTSVPLADLRLKALLIDSPRLAVRRDPSGRLHIGGIEMETDASADDSAFADWVMRQPQIVVRDALVVWNDEKRNAPQLLLDHVQFRLEQRLGRHRVGLTGTPPPELAAPIDLRADLSGGSLKDPQSLTGKVYLRLDYADVAAWRDWLPLPVAVDSGEGALRVWADLSQSRPIDVVADLELADVRASLGEGLSPLTLAHVAGRVGWKRAGARTDYTAVQLSLALPDGTGFAPTDLALTLEEPATGASGGGRIAFKDLELRPLAAVAAHLPLPEGLRRDIEQYGPSGTLRDGTIEWVGSADAPERYSVKGQFQRFGIAPRDALPGVANVSGTIDASERGGQLHVDSRAATIVLPRLFADPLAFDSVKGDVAWQRDGATTVTLKGVAFANADLAGTTAGTWRSHAAGPGEIDLKAQLTRASLASLPRYLPAVAGPAVRDWVRRALVKGTSSDARLTLAGDLASFPFAQGKGGRFEIAVKAQDATLDYADNWPPITAIAADVRLDGTRIAVDATSGRVLNAQLGATHAEIPDLRDAQPVLRIDGTASGPTGEFLAFIAASPVAGWIGHVADGATATGDGRLALKFELPLREHERTTIAGEYRMVANTVRLAGMPELTGLGGTLAFTEHDVRASDLTGQAFGGPARLQLASENGHVRVSGSGTADVQRVRAEYDAPLLDRVSGSTDWRLALDAHDAQVDWTVESSLQGASVDLPAPIGKRATQKVPLRIERRETSAREDRLDVDYGGIARVVLQRKPGAPARAIDRALVLVGKAIGEATLPTQPGVWVRADVATLNLDDWLDVDLSPRGAASQAASGDAPAVSGLELRAESLEALGRNFTKVRTTARRQNGDWRISVEGDELAGTATWLAATPTQPNGRLVARLSRLATPAAADHAVAGGGNAPAAPAGAPRRWPAVDLVADALIRRGRGVGRLEMIAQPAGPDWQIQKLALANDAGRIDASGWWRTAPPAAPRTRLDVAIDVKEAGAFLARFGWPDAVKGAPTKIAGQVSWAGAPSDFDYPSLSGQFELASGAGQFTKLEPGVGRLLGVLSLQALPRRISLDFRDVFSEGFAFDTVAGNVRMESGIMHTDQFRLVGPSAVVNIAGDVDLARETQRLKVRVQPSLSSGVSAGAAALFIANPLLGAAVGAGTLLAQKMLNNPFDQLFSYQYAVDGSWDDPVVTRVAAAAASAPSSAVR